MSVMVFHHGSSLLKRPNKEINQIIALFNALLNLNPFQPAAVTLYFLVLWVQDSSVVLCMSVGRSVGLSVEHESKFNEFI